MPKFRVEYCRTVWEYYTVEVEADDDNKIDDILNGEEWRDPLKPDSVDGQEAHVLTTEELSDED